MPKSKTKTLKEHTAKRLRERYGLKYTQRLHDTLLHMIRCGQAKLVVKQSLRVSVFDVVCDIKEADICNSTVTPGPMPIRFAYDRNRKTLITVLAPDMHPDDMADAILEDENL